MPEISASITPKTDRSVLYTWQNVTNADTFQPVKLDSAAAEISVHISGTILIGSVSIKGSNDGSEGIILSKPSGSEATASAASIFMVEDRPLYITPVHNMGVGSSVSVYMLVRK